jgi:acyl carrier protein
MDHRAQVLDHVTTALHDELGVPADEVTPHTDLRTDLGLDSIDLVELVTRLEDEVGMPMPEDKVQDLHTVDDVVDLVCTLAAEQNGRT